MLVSIKYVIYQAVHRALHLPFVIRVRLQQHVGHLYVLAVRSEVPRRPCSLLPS
jgi:hypothetical protein